MDSQLDVNPVTVPTTKEPTVTRIATGLSRQHFINVTPTLSSKGTLYDEQLLGLEWKIEEKKPEPPPEAPKIVFSTEVDEKVLENARKRLKDNDSLSTILLPDSWELRSREKLNYNEDAEKIKLSLLKTANDYYEKCIEYYNKCDFEQAIISLNKALNLNSFNLQYHLLKCDAYVQLGDIKSAILTLNKLFSLVVKLSSENNDQQYDVLKASLSQKLAFYYYLQGQTFYDCTYYLEALDSFTKASELKENNLTYRIRSVSCLVALNRTNEALAFVNKIIEESEEMQQNVHLYVLRARLHLKYNNQTLCFYDVRDALALEPNHKEASHLMKMIEDASEQMRNSALILSINGRASDALNKMSAAISMNPSKAEYNLQRGILYKRLRNFNAAIDEFILGLDKIDHNAAKEPQLFSNLQRQILLTYNDFAIQCFNRKFYDESILLLNKAIRLEKNEKGLYVNRGDCFFKKNDFNFALLDYEQALELDPKDVIIKNRIATVNYLTGVQYYDEKNYKLAYRHFCVAIKHAPHLCKYYISRARTLYLQENLEAAKVDICISVLLDPVNQEIPSIISRLFENQNLSDVMTSSYMKKAYEHLEKLNLQKHLKHPQMLLFTSIKFNRNPKKNAKSSMSDDQFSKTSEENHKNDLDLIEQKKMVRQSLKSMNKPDLRSNSRKLLPLPEPEDSQNDETNNYGLWRKYHSGIFK